jgi:hypothetical protein
MCSKRQAIFGDEKALQRRRRGNQRTASQGVRAETPQCAEGCAVLQFVLCWRGHGGRSARSRYPGDGHCGPARRRRVCGRTDPINGPADTTSLATRLPRMRAGSCMPRLVSGECVSGTRRYFGAFVSARIIPFPGNGDCDWQRPVRICGLRGRGPSSRNNFSYPLSPLGLIDLQLVTGRTVIVPVVWASCGVMGERRRLECPLCGRRVCALYHLDGRVACRRCNGLWFAAQRRRRPDGHMRGHCGKRELIRVARHLEPAEQDSNCLFEVSQCYEILFVSVSRLAGSC